MEIKKAIFHISCPHANKLPDSQYPEFAFVGRSNVGKSSLINMVTGRKNLVKVGAKPGVTKMINFFIINDNISIADLPGFGFAKVPLQVRKTFLPMVRGYISKRQNLRLVFLLVDIRRVPEEFEKNIITLLSENEIPTAIIATKCDKLSKNKRKLSIEKISTALNIDPDSIFLTSAKSREGRKALLELIGEYSQ